MGDLMRLWQKYQQINGQPPIPLYPQQYSLDGDGTKAEQIKYSDYCLCGNISQMKERWVADGTICDKCGDAEQMERWVVVDPSGQFEYYCEECPAVKLYAVYSDSSFFTVDCNSASNLTRNEVRSNQAISYSAMTSASIGTCVSLIGTQAFRGCSGLTKVIIPSTVTELGEEAFRSCVALTSVTLPDSITTIGDLAFTNCTQMSSAYLPSGITRISESMFEQCTNLNFITIPSGVTTIGNYAFANDNRLTITFESTTPATLEMGIYSAQHHFDTVMSIRVPGAAIAAYSNAWPNWSSKLTGY